MARLDFAIDHGQSRAAAHAKFEQAVTAAIARFQRWIHRADWAPDRESVRMAGPGFDVELSFDDHKVYARGSVPIAFKVMEGPIRLFVARALADES